MESRFLNKGALALLQIAIVGNMQILPANALYGLSLPFLFLLAFLFFYLPCVLMTAELATTHPQTGGAYIWCEKAFGPKVGFFTVTLFWIANLLWYPSIFSLIAANFAYLFNPLLAQNKIFVMGFSLVLFWSFTALNCAGVRISTKVSTWCSVLGIIIPMIFIISCGGYWLITHKTLAVSTHTTPIIPNLLHLDNLGYLISIVITMFGIELTSVHAGNVVNPSRDYPLSLLRSSIITLTLLLFSALAIAMIIPKNQLSVLTGLLDALVLFFNQSGISAFIVPILFLVFLGNMGSLAAWMLGSTRGIAVAAQHNKVARFLQITNKAEAPVGVLIFEAIVFTLATGIFLLFSEISNTFWLLLDLASQITLIYYITLFISAIRLRYLPTESTGFLIPGGKMGIWTIMGFGILTSVLSLGIGFIPPKNLGGHEVFIFHLIMTTGLIISILLPIIFLSLKVRKTAVS